MYVLLMCMHVRDRCVCAFDVYRCVCAFLMCVPEETGVYVLLMCMPEETGVYVLLMCMHEKRQVCMCF